MSLIVSELTWDLPDNEHTENRIRNKEYGGNPSRMFRISAQIADNTRQSHCCHCQSCFGVGRLAAQCPSRSPADLPTAWRLGLPGARPGRAGPKLMIPELG